MEDTSTTCWTLKDDLIVSRQENSEGVLYVVKDPSTERFFRFKEIEHFIAQQFDGYTSLKTIGQRVREKFSIEIPTEAILEFAKRLQNIGLLNTDDTQAPKKRNFFQGDIFYLRCKLFNPDRFYDWVLPKIKFLFTPAFIVVSALVVIFAISITVTEWNSIMH